MLKTHKIALDPNNVQSTQFAQHCGYARVAYNHALADFKAGLDNGVWRSHINLQCRFNAVKYDQYQWVRICRKPRRNVLFTITSRTL